MATISLLSNMKLVRDIGTDRACSTNEMISSMRSSGSTGAYLRSYCCVLPTPMMGRRGPVARPPSARRTGCESRVSSAGAGLQPLAIEVGYVRRGSPPHFTTSLTRLELRNE